MEFQQPQTVPTDKEIEATLNALRIQISDKQAEIVRQEKIINSNRYTIQQTANEKAELLNQKEDLENKIFLLKPQLEELELSKNKLKDEAVIIKSEIEEQKNEINNKWAELDIQIKKTQEFKEEVNKDKEKLEIEKKEINQKEIDIANKIQALKVIIN